MIDSDNHDEQQHEESPSGRPLLFDSVEKLDDAIDQYLGDCSPHIATRREKRTKEDGKVYWAEVEVMTEQKPVTVTGAAVALSTSRRTLLNYKKRDPFFPSIQRLLDYCEAYSEGQLFGPYANGAKFSLANNFKGTHQDWSERQVVAGDPDAPLSNPYAPLTTEQLRAIADQRIAEDQADGADASDSA